MEAEDVAQETYLRMLRLRDATAIEQPHAYLYRVATHVVRELGKKEDAQAKLPLRLGEELADLLADHSPEDWADVQDQLEHLDHVLERMPPVYRAVLILRKQAGLSHQDIAVQLNLSPHTVKKYMHRALAWCREQWRTEHLP